MLRRFILMAFLLSIACTAVANVRNLAQIIPAYNYQIYDQAIQHLYQNLPKKTTQISGRVAAISSWFLGTPYLLGALGEGSNGYYDQSPLYRTDAFDCVTFVSTVIALASAQNLQQFQNNISAIDYSDGIPNFITRNHFMEIDWNINNAHKGFIRDITANMVNENGKPIAAIHSSLIDKPNWFRALPASELKFLQPLSSQETQKRLQALHREALNFSAKQSAVPYIPLTQLYDAGGNPNTFVFNQIPSGTIIEILQQKANLLNKIGTAMDITHLGLAIRTPQGLMLREASSRLHKVVDIPLEDYLRSYLAINNKNGINLQQILPRGTRA